MTVPILDQIPEEIWAGVTTSWRASYDGHSPADGDELLVTLSNGTETFFGFTVTPEDSTWLVTNPYTSDLAAGDYTFQVVVSNFTNSTKVMVESGSLRVHVFFDGATPFDARTDAEIMLDALNAMLKGKASQDQSSMMLNGRQLTRLSPKELLTWRDQMKAEVARDRATEKNKRGLPTGRKTRVRF